MVTGKFYLNQNWRSEIQLVPVIITLFGKTVSESKKKEVIGNNVARAQEQ